MKAKQLKRACLALPGATEDFPFDPEVSVFRVGGKIFGLSRLAGDPLRISLKCAPELAVRLRAEHPAVVPGYHLNKRHWNTVAIDGSVPDRLLLDMIEDSYDLVAESLTRAQRAESGLPAKPRVVGERPSAP
jgi:predicted DNA-binding protein (MmcQ/YjbR family)